MPLRSTFLFAAMSAVACGAGTPPSESPDNVHVPGADPNDTPAGDGSVPESDRTPPAEAPPQASTASSYCFERTVVMRTRYGDSDCAPSKAECDEMRDKVAAQGGSPGDCKPGSAPSPSPAP